MHDNSRQGEGRVVLDTAQKQLRELAGILPAKRAKQVVEFVDYCEKHVDERAKGQNRVW